MNADELRPPTGYRAAARRLLKEVRSPESGETLEAAAARFRRLKTFADKTDTRVSRDAKLKHALTVVALEQGYASWRALKAASGQRAAGPAMYAGELDVFLNRWFTGYEEARAALEEEGGFLLPYAGHQFFVCGEGAIRTLGLDPDDPDWELAGRDWVSPLDPRAWSRLAAKREQALLGRR